MKESTPHPLARGKVFAVAPMMDWTDRHCRFFHRQMSRHAVLYTEMLTEMAVRRGDRQKLLAFDPREQDVVLQLGGSNPKGLAEAARIGQDFNYRAINLNVGCPSDKVQEGRFGACLMAEPDLVADCVNAMQRAVEIPVTVKCRIGIDDQDEDEGLQTFVTKVSAAGCRTFIIHARKAWLKGLSPKENREIPPLNYDRVHRLKQSFPALSITLNGGLTNPQQDIVHLRTLDGLMYGRAAYQNPWMLTEIDDLLTGKPGPAESREQVVQEMIAYATHELKQGQPLHRITRHMLGLFHGQRGGKIWRQVLSTQATRPGATADVLRHALACMHSAAPSVAAA